MNGGESYTSVRGPGTPEGYQHLETYAFPNIASARRATADVSRRARDGAVLVRIAAGEDGLSAVEAAAITAEVAARNRITFRDSRRPVPRVLYASESRWREVTFESFRAVWRIGPHGRYRTLTVASDIAVPAREYLEMIGTEKVSQGDESGSQSTPS